jgi:hypothetical protein
LASPSDLDGEFADKPGVMHIAEAKNEFWNIVLAWAKAVTEAGRPQR